MVFTNGISVRISPPPTPNMSVDFDPFVERTINNALVECALVMSRTLAYFFTRPSDVHFTKYDPDWHDDVIAVAEKIESPISQHHSHATPGAKDGEPLPGEWPIPELAVTLVGGLARFVQTLDTASTHYEVGWFTPSAPGYQPSPTELFAALMSVDPLAQPTEVSANPSVGALTRALQKYLALI
jgi:hypothetical protein